MRILLKKYLVLRKSILSILSKALRKLIDEGIIAWPAVMYEIFGDSGLRKIKERLKMEG